METLEWTCNAIPADPDIGGPGVIVGFVAVAWYATLLATVEPICITMNQVWLSLQPERLNTSDWPLVSKIRGVATRQLLLRPRLGDFLRRDRTRGIIFVRILLDSLGDVQLITGTAILIAAWSRIKTMSFYHLQLSYCYYWLTVNSFSSCRAGGRRVATETIPWPIRVRTIISFCTVMLGIVLCSYINIWVNAAWDPLYEGRCFLSHDQSKANTEWLWIVGLISYAVYLLYFLCTMGQRNRNRVEAVRLRMSTKTDQWRKMYYAHCTSILIGKYGQHHSIFRCSLELCFYLPDILLKLLLDFVDIIAGTRDSLLALLGNMGFAAWFTYNIVDYKISNKELLEGSESTWGFGQIVPPLRLAARGKTRLAKWYAPFSDEEKIKVKGEVHRLVAPRDQKYQSNFVEFRSHKIVYRRYAGLFFCVCVDTNDNELAYLEAIHFFVEVLDAFFGNVSELDLVFNFYKVYAILDEVFLAGEIEETSKQAVLTRLEHLDKLE
ncbi:hypothetical protein V2A60_007574 [Cordyceps javanica]|uniref:AP-2 complex subunit sigma n=1 Tax=Cordyceps javanica TaxID=43265 RepID=A0A545W7F1_9HYPO|nr:AP-2 complex subunit sigma [Cordyceps javanica]TQW09930.1 AP-2 complex subunit sigma [Cordyceps javanica]